MESSIINSSSIRTKWHCWKSRTTSERRNFSSTATIRIRWKLVGWFYGMLLLFAKDLLADGKTPYERRFGEPLKGPVVPFGATVELSSDFTERSIKTLSIWQAILILVSVLALSWSRGEIGNEIFWLRFRKIWKSCTHQKFITEESTRKKYRYHRKGNEFIFPVADDTAKLSGSDHEFGEPGNKPKGAKISAENFIVNRESLNRQNLQMTLKPTLIWTSCKRNVSMTIGLSIGNRSLSDAWNGP